MKILNFLFLFFFCIYSNNSYAEIFYIDIDMIINQTNVGKHINKEFENAKKINNAKNLETKELPDPDLIIRTSGEYRLSNFLLLQSAYAEIYISPIYWPDFNKHHFDTALEQYALRERRYGALK